MGFFDSQVSSLFYSRLCLHFPSCPYTPFLLSARYGMVWIFYSFCFVIPLELEKSKWVAVCAFCVLFYALFFIPPCFVIPLCIYSTLPVDAKAYAYLALVNSHISSLFLIQFARVCSLSHSRTYLAGGFPRAPSHIFFHSLSSSGFSFLRGQFHRRLVSSHLTSFLLSMVVWLF